MPSGGRAAALVRIATGILFTALGLEKLVGDFVRGGFAKGLPGMLSHSWPFWRSFLQSMVAPRASVFAWIVAGAEAALGLALVLGLWTRPACAAGVLLMIVILLGQSYTPGASWSDWLTSGLTTRFTILLLLLLAASDAGRVWGIDARRGARVRRGSIRR
jgi:uncharacterized membrane protein YphA (DoxX/SURF4 family)